MTFLGQATEVLEISPVRLRTLLEILREESGDPESFLEELPGHLAGYLRSLDQDTWLPAEVELDLCERLCLRFDLYSHLIRVGREGVINALTLLMPTVSQKTSIQEIIQRIPSSIALFLTHANAQILQSGKNRLFYVRLVYDTSRSPNVVDCLFIQGVIEGLLQFFRLAGYKTGIASLQLSETSVLLEELSHTIQWEDDENLFFIDLANVRFSRQDTHLHPAEHSIDQQDAYVQSVMNRSSQLLQDKRDLMTAVEYLNLANDELERQLKANKKELKMARNIQKGFVPPRIPDWKGLQFWIKFYPLTEVSGDFYDYFNLGSEKLALLVADVSGHGVPAALISAIAKLSFSNHKLDSPSEVFSKVNFDLLRYVKREGYLTGFYMIVRSDYTIHYSIGAAPRPLLYRRRTGTVERLPGSGTMLGMFPDASDLYMDQVTHLEPGDKLVIFTDGMTEAENRYGEFWDEEGVVEALSETKEMDVQQTSEHIMERYRNFILGTEAKDDLTLITIMLSERTEEFEELVRSGRQSYNQSQIETACERLRQAIKIFPRHTGTLFLLAKYLAQKGNYLEASDYMHQYNILKPYNADAYTVLAYCSYHLQHYEKAQDELKRALSLRHENPSALFNLVKVYYKLGLEEEARNAFHALEFLRPNHPRVQELRKKYGF